MKNVRESLVETSQSLSLSSHRMKKSGRRITLQCVNNGISFRQFLLELFLETAKSFDFFFYYKREKENHAVEINITS